MDAGGSISRRTRSRSEAFWDSYYRKRYDEIKKNRDQDSSSNGESTMEHNENTQSFETKYESFVKKGVAEDSDDYERSSDDDDDDDDNGDDSDRDYEYVEKKGSRKFGRPAKKKARVIEKHDFFTMLEDLKWEERDLIRENPACVEERENVVSEGYALPLKFSLTFEDGEKVEKTDWEREIDSFFDDLEMGLWESEIGCRNSSSIDDECCLSIDETPMARCDRGEHDHVLDEQIGIVCRYCLAVLLDIKHVLSPFHVETSEKHERKDMEESNNTIMNQIEFQSPNSSNLESSINQSTGTVFDLIPDSKKKLFPHQMEGFEFLWRNIAGETHLKNLERLPSNGGRGCIISHAPGTGKTRLTIVFLLTFMKLYPNCRPVIIAPRGMLLTWEQELKKWEVGINFHNLNEPKLSDQENETIANIADQTRKSRDYIRFIKLLSWMKGGSILGVGYRLFEELAGEHERKKHDKFKKVLLEVPSLLVMDEGHTPRNHQTLMWKALTKVKTQRRVILSGTPFQNNFSELYNTLCLVNPRFSHQIMMNNERRFRRKGKGNAARDEWAILTNSIRKNSRSDDDGLKKLRLMIEPFVHIHKGNVLRETLPGMRDCLIILKPTDLQKILLQNITRIEKFLEQDHLASLISVHPSLVSKKPEFSDHKRKLNSLKSDPNAGVKTRFLITLVQLSSRLNEKVLIFSEFISPLIHIKSLLKSHFKWNEGREIMYMDGDISLKQRQRLINSFNDKKGSAKVMLASQRACSEGINLVGASRVVLLDVAWNPQVERQAICRAYRIGQERMVYVYHLVTLMEVKKYERQAEKERISELLFSSGGGGGGGRCSGGEGAWEDKVLEAMVRQESGGDMFERIVHQPKESDWMNTFGFVDLK